MPTSSVQLLPPQRGGRLPSLAMGKDCHCNQLTECTLDACLQELEQTRTLFHLEHFTNMSHNCRIGASQLQGNDAIGTTEAYQSHSSACLHLNMFVVTSDEPYEHQTRSLGMQRLKPLVLLHFCAGAPETLMAQYAPCCFCKRVQRTFCRQSPFGGTGPYTSTGRQLGH